MHLADLASSVPRSDTRQKRAAWVLPLRRERSGCGLGPLSSTRAKRAVRGDRAINPRLRLGPCKSPIIFACSAAVLEGPFEHAPRSRSVTSVLVLSFGHSAVLEKKSLKSTYSKTPKVRKTSTDLPEHFAICPLGVGSAVNAAGCGGYGGPCDGRVCGEVCGTVYIPTSSFGSYCGFGHECAFAYGEVAAKAELPRGGGRGYGRGGRRRWAW